MSYLVYFEDSNDGKGLTIARPSLAECRAEAERGLRDGATGVYIYKLLETVKIQAIYEPVEAQDKPSRRKRTPEADSAPQEALVSFNELWKAYPLKVGKNHALKAYLRVRGKVSDEEIAEGIVRYIHYVEARQASDFPDLKFKDGGTWFHQRGWMDECRITEKEEEKMPWQTGE